MKNIGIYIDIDMNSPENIDIDIDNDILENIDINKGILQNIDIDKDLAYRTPQVMVERVIIGR